MRNTVLITGANGLLGTELRELLRTRYRVIATDTKDMDILRADAVRTMFDAEKPGIVIHCAAYTAVDRAETDQKACWDINVEGTQRIVEQCGRIGAELVLFSTDYVFDGHGQRPWEVDDECNPINHYGMTKWQGEMLARASLPNAYIVRTSWLFGNHGRNFVQAVLNKCAEREIAVVCDQVGSPTYAPHLAKAVCGLLQTGRYGTYHITNEGYCSWAEFARAIFSLAHENTRVLPVSSDAYPTAAKRPKNSRLSKAALDAIGMARLPGWEEGLAEYLSEHGKK